MAGLAGDRGFSEKVREVISTVIDNILDNLKTTGRDSISLNEIQQKHSKEVTREHMGRRIVTGVLDSRGPIPKSIPAFVEVCPQG